MTPWHGDRWGRQTWTTLLLWSWGLLGLMLKAKVSLDQDEKTVVLGRQKGTKDSVDLRREGWRWLVCFEPCGSHTWCCVPESSAIVSRYKETTTQRGQKTCLWSFSLVSSHTRTRTQTVSTPGQFPIRPACCALVSTQAPRGESAWREIITLHWEKSHQFCFLESCNPQRVLRPHR